MPEAKQVLFVLQDDSLVLDWAGPAEALRLAGLEIAALKLDVAPFALRFAAAQGQAIGSVGIQLQALEALPDSLPEGSWVVLVGRTAAAEARAAQRHELIAWLARLAPGRPGLRLVTVCSGALLAAQAGLLAGRRATTHHHHLDDLARLEPRCTVLQDRVFVQDGEVYTSAGVTAGIDLALHLIAAHAGELVAARVAEQMAVALRRGPADPELSPLLAHRQHLNARLHRVQDALSLAPAEDWPLEHGRPRRHDAAHPEPPVRRACRHQPPGLSARRAPGRGQACAGGWRQRGGGQRGGRLQLRAAAAPRLGRRGLARHAVQRTALTRSSGGIAVHPLAPAIHRLGLAALGVSDETAITDTATHRSPP